METIKSFLCTIGIIGFLFGVINCSSLSSPSASVSSSPIVIKKINSVNNLSSPPSPPPPVSSSSSSSSLGDDQPVDGSINSLNSEYDLIRSSVSHGSDSVSNTKVSEPLLMPDYHPIRSSLASNFGQHRGPVNLGSSTQTPSLTSSFSSSFSPSKLFPSLFSPTSSTNRISNSFPVHSFSLRPINRLLELFPRNDYSEESPNGSDNFPPKVFHHKRQQPPQFQQQHNHHHQQQQQGDKTNHEQLGNSLSSPVFYSNDLYPDLTKQGSISRLPLLINSYGARWPFGRKSPFRSIFDRLFG